MKEYKVIKIWYVNAEDDKGAIKATIGRVHDFVSANDTFKYDTRKDKK